MTNPQKKKKQEIIEIWNSLKEQITSLLSELDSNKVNQTQIIERYEKKLTEKNKQITELETESVSGDDAFLPAVLKEIRLMISIPANASEEQFLTILKNLRQDYRRLRGFDSGSD